jgi:polysaccharide biosynthesis transport protein
MRQTSADFNLWYVLRAARRRLPIFLLCVVLVPTLAVVVSHLQKKEYTAKASLLFRDPQFDQKLFDTSFVQNQTDPQRAAATNLESVSIPKVAALTAARLRNLTGDQVSSAVEASSNSQSDLVAIEATARSPGFAAKLANTFANQYIAFRRKADRAKISSAQVPLQRQIAALPPRERFGAFGQSLQKRLSQLKVLASLQTGNAELLQPAQVPRGASSPKPVRNGAIGVFFGILIGIALALVAEALDRRLRKPTEMEEIFKRPLLASLPESAALASPDPGLPAAELEDFRMLWVNLRYFNVSGDISSVLVTSADRNDGKSTVAWGLAVAAASTGSRTLLVEADFRNPTFANRFGLRSRKGLTGVLLGKVARREAVKPLPLALKENDSSPARAMDVLITGRRPPDPADLLQSGRMVEFLREVEEEYDLVIIDTPPASVVSDAIPLTTIVSGVIVVGRLGNTGRDHLRRLHHQLDHMEARILGVVVNSIEQGDPYGYGYDYGEADISERRSNGARSRRERQAAAVAVAPSGADLQAQPRTAAAPDQRGPNGPADIVTPRSAKAAQGPYEGRPVVPTAQAPSESHPVPPAQTPSQSRPAAPTQQGARKGTSARFVPTLQRRLRDWLT